VFDGPRLSCEDGTACMNRWTAHQYLWVDILYLLDNQVFLLLARLALVGDKGFLLKLKVLFLRIMGKLRTLRVAKIQIALQIRIISARYVGRLSKAKNTEAVAVVGAALGL